MSAMAKLRAQAEAARAKAAAEPPREAAVLPDRTLNYTSVSAVKKFMSCEAAWFFRYVERLPDESGPGADASSVMHEEVEHYLKTGNNVLSDVPRSALAYFEEPGKPGPFRNRLKDDPEGLGYRMLDISAEQNFGDDGFELTAAGVRFKGYIDLVNPRGVAETGVVRLRDWKFKSDIVKYGCTPEDLVDPTTEDGIQMVGYAMALHNAVESKLFPGWEHVKAVQLEHLHVQKKKPAKASTFPVNPVVARPIDRQSVPALWARVEAVVERMKLAALEPTAATVGADTTQCRKFNGCNFRDHCPHFKGKANRGARLTSLFSTPSHAQGQGPEMEEETMGVIANLKKPVAAPAAPAVAPPAPTPAPAPAPSKLVIEDQSTIPDDVLKAQRAEAEAATAWAKQVAAGTAPAETVAAKAVGVLPPDAPQSAPAAKVETPAPAPLPAAVVAPEPVQAAPVAATLEEKPKATRKAKATAPAAAPSAGFTLYKRGAPTKTKAQSFADYVAKLETEVIADLKAAGVGAAAELEDLRMSSGNDIGFGKWKGYLASAAKESPPAPGAYIVHPGDDRIDTVFAALESLAAEVVL